MAKQSAGRVELHCKRNEDGSYTATVVVNGKKDPVRAIKSSKCQALKNLWRSATDEFGHVEIVGLCKGCLSKDFFQGEAAARRPS
ncbi:MAG: hypothetical protein ACJ8F7_23480 [Gemmataceae bacterium]